MRKEKDFLGDIDIPSDKYYGAATQRSLNHSFEAEEKIPREFIVAYAFVKKAAAWANHQLGALSYEKKEVISHVCDRIIAGEMWEHFPLTIWQPGSGTPTHMNVNEVIANYAGQHCGVKLHPLDDVNLSQSTNDTFPCAMHLALYQTMTDRLLPIMGELEKIVFEKEREFCDTMTIGRTHMMDAVPMTYGDMFSGYRYQISFAKKNLKYALNNLLAIPFGGTAIGTKIGAPLNFGLIATRFLSEFTSIPFTVSENLFHAISFHDTLVLLSGGFRLLALALHKMASDFILLSSGPKAGFNEMILPAVEPGSSIMPAKVNPGQCEMMKMIVQRVISNDEQLIRALMDSPLQLHVYKPLLIHSLFNSLFLLSNGGKIFAETCIRGITVNKQQLQKNIEHCHMSISAISARIGYDRAACIVQKAREENISLEDAAALLKLFSKEEFQKLLPS
ncbi:MAG: class II fumarate hydratase [Parachlamydiales bacterium]|nr:class II fumarate hydratase [Parachlamydiales bacterium]